MTAPLQSILQLCQLTEHKKVESITDLAGNKIYLAGNAKAFPKQPKQPRQLRVRCASRAEGEVQVWNNPPHARRIAA